MNKKIDKKMMTKEFEAWFATEFRRDTDGLFGKVQKPKSKSDVYMRWDINFAYACYTRLQNEITNLREERDEALELVAKLEK